MIKVEILSPEWSRELEVEAIFLPGVLGEFEVLVNHAPIISLLSAGDIKWRCADAAEGRLSIKGGTIRLKENHMQICIETK